VILHSCERKNVFRRKLASWNLEFCSSCVVLFRNVQVPRRNSDSLLVFRDPTQLRAKKTYLVSVLDLEFCYLASFYFEMYKFHDPTEPYLEEKLLVEFCSSCVVLLRNVQVPRRNSDSHLVFRDPTQLRAKKRI
jgi:ribosomal protein S26